jgi:hypothetical protein
MQVREQEIIALTARITDVLAEHPNALEAETACSMAKELASLRAKQMSHQWREDSKVMSA